MLGYLREVQQRYVLEPGNLRLSSLTQLSSALCLDYCSMVQEGSVSDILLMTYPEKTEITKWVSSVLLINLFIGDYAVHSQNRIESLNIKSGDYIEFFSTVGRFNGILDNNRASIKFRYSEIETHPNNFAYINPTKKRKADEIKVYFKNKKKQLRKRQALAKILSLDTGVNPDLLSSNGLIICGRGNVSNLRRSFMQSTCYDEPLSQVILLNERIQIESDLSCLSDILQSKSDERKIEYFQNSLNLVLKSAITSDASINTKIALVLSLLKEDYRSAKFWAAIEELSDLLSSGLEPEEEVLYKKIKNILQYFPEKDTDEIPRPSFVIINDVEQLIAHKETIQALIKENIPVIALTDRNVEIKAVIGIYDRLFEFPEYMDSLRINWSRNKIRSLSQGRNLEGDLDDLFFNDMCGKFESQKIKLKIFEDTDSELAYETFECSRLVSAFIGLERLQKAYFQSLRPLIYYLKNNISLFQNQQEAIDVLEDFKSIYQELCKFFSPEDQSRVENGICSLEKLIQNGTNTKQYWGSRVLFMQTISMGGNLYTIPETKDIAADFTEFDEAKDQSVTFCGFPYRESNYGFLRNAVLSSMTPMVNVLSWKLEGEITYNYLYKRILSGYFLDRVPERWGFFKGLLFEYPVDIQKEIAEMISIEEEKELTVAGPEVDDFESIQEIITNFRFSDIQKDSSSESEDFNSYVVKVNVIHLENNCFALVPFDSRVLVIRELEDGTHNSDYFKFEDIHPGDIFAHTEVSKESLKKTVESSSKMSLVIDSLYFWREILHDYLNQPGNNIRKLVQELTLVKAENNLSANPSKINIARWLHDELILAPNTDNLKMILLLQVPLEKLDSQIDKIYKDRLQVIGLKRQISEKIKERVSRILSRNQKFTDGRLDFKLEGIDTSVEVGKIIGLEPRQDLSVEYMHTRKILKD